MKKPLKIPGDILKISIIGTGYVGLVSGVGFAAKGHSVIGVDARSVVVEKIAGGESPIHEEGLSKELETVLKNGSFSVTTNLADAVRKTDITFICVGTPSREDGSINLGAIRKCAGQIGEVLLEKEEFHTIVVKSTVLPGTTTEVVGKTISEISKKEPGAGFGLGMNPEFLREGNAVNDFFKPDRIVIGSNDAHSRERISEVYNEKFNAPITHVNIPTAEMIKYTNNAFLGLCISFSNEIAQICERAGGIDAVDVLRALAQDGRITTRTENGERIVPGIASYLFPGCGFGGSCFPKDLNAIRHFARSKKLHANLIEDTIAVNEARIKETAQRAESILGEVKGKKIAILGTAFKQDTDDIRESPALKMMDYLLERGAILHAYDPEALENTRAVYGERISYSKSAEEALQGAELAIVATKWDEFKRLTPSEFQKTMKRPAVLDCRRMYDKKEYSDGIEYYGVGIGEP